MMHFCFDTFGEETVVLTCPDPTNDKPIQKCCPQNQYLKSELKDEPGNPCIDMPQTLTDNWRIPVNGYLIDPKDVLNYSTPMDATLLKEVQITKST